MEKILTPNRVTLIRVLFAIAAVTVYGAAPRAYALQVGIASIALTFLAVTLDGLDGFLARRFHLVSPIGAQLDILGDRVLENLFFTFFAVSGELSLWVPLLFFARGSITDFLRGLASARERDACDSAFEYRRKWFLEGKWGKASVASPASRVAYGALKCACFCALGIEWTLHHVAGIVSAPTASFVSAASTALVAATIAFCILRALPVLWEGRLDVLSASQPFSHVTRISAPVQNLQALRGSAHHAAAR
jgi:CDP-diacylglycerol--glycerol-3-phosphate 3-phosphatidyltransferase